MVRSKSSTRSEYIKVLVSPREKRAIKRLALKSKKSASDYLRSLALPSAS